MKLSKRLQMNADLVPPGMKLADIGCDHGYVSIYLSENEICKKVIAMDINRGPLEIARKNIAGAGLTGKIECRLSDGLSGLEPGEADALMIAGMGGMLVCEILNRNPDVMKAVQVMILQVQSDWANVRRLLPQLGFYIDDETICHDSGKYYIAIRAVRGRENKPYSDTEYAYGRILPEKKDCCYVQYLREERDRMQKVKNSLKKHKSEESLERTKEIKHILQQIDTILTKCREEIYD